MGMGLRVGEIAHVPFDIESRIFLNHFNLLVKNLLVRRGQALPSRP